jgi:ABC-type dipeptide/oligopeptide/nickel transport system ATPase component
MPYHNQIGRIRRVMEEDLRQHMEGMTTSQLREVIDDMMIFLSIEDLESILRDWPSNLSTRPPTTENN